MRRHLLVTEGDVINSESSAGIDQRVVGVAALSENLADTFLFETFGNKHGAVHARNSLMTNLS
jgi:hypothetical protein